jgi:hypothetical protein
MRPFVRLALVAWLAAIAAGCGDSGGAANPKVQNNSGTELKPLPAPGSPAGGAPKKKQPGGGPN